MISRKNVLVVSPYLPPHLGGVEQYVDNLARRLHERHGWRVVIASTTAESTTAPFIDTEHARIYRLPSQLLLSNTPLGVRWSRLLKDVIAHERIDLVNAHAPVPLLADVAARCSAGLPFVLTYHAGPMRNGRVLYDTASKLYERYLLAATARRADQVITSSDFVAQTFQGIFAGKTTTISPGVDTELFSEGGTRDPNLILFVGSLNKTAHYKGLPDLLSALSIIRERRPGVRLEVVGDGDAMQNHIEFTRQRGLRECVTFLGLLDKASLATANRRASLLALPTYYDSFPTVLVEAMSTGRPVVSTTVGGIPTLVDDGVNGYLVEPGDVPRLASTIGELLDDEARAVAMGRRGAEKVREQLSWTKQAHRTAQVFEKAIAMRSGENARKTVAVVAPYYPPKVGGVEHYAQRLARDIAGTDDLRAVVITTKPQGFWSDVIERDGLTVVRLGVLFRLSNTPINPIWFFAVRRALRRHRIDAVHAHAPTPFLADVAIRAAGSRPSVITYHSGSMVKNSRLTDVVIRFYESQVLSRTFSMAHRVIAASPMALPAKRIGVEVITPGVDTTVFTPCVATAVPKMTVLYVGRMDRASSWKGIDVLLKAFVRIVAVEPSARLRLVGGGDAADEMRMLAKRLDIDAKTEFCGVLTGQDLVDAYCQAGVLVAPSLTEAEAFGMSLIEAMACGCPVIGSKVGGIPFVIEDKETGLLVPPGDVDALAKACLRILRDESVSRRLSLMGRRRAESTYDWQSKTGRHIELLRELLRAPGPSVH